MASVTKQVESIFYLFAALVAVRSPFPIPCDKNILIIAHKKYNIIGLLRVQWCKCFHSFALMEYRNKYKSTQLLFTIIIMNFKQNTIFI